MEKEELIAKMFKALGHPIRFKIVLFLLDGRKCVCELNGNIEFSQANLSQHLKILKDAGILSSEREGPKIFYSLRNNDIKKMVHCADEFLVNYVKSLSDNFQK
ncbi:metalloregulator ArsR/SmtB family transcription factor [Bacillus sp. T3]|uniref:ArsR/SmtB family transcription factor n=1 Tax=Bacillus sp. T3 TaxID=467262 RepID=UPI0029825693|nr:metalloregulator ArsR/SmtB family transcription factor [Bacillus sp. T3]